VTLDELHAVDPQLCAALVELCDDKTALASMLCARIAGLAADAATTAERARCVEHLALADLGGATLTAIAVAAIRDGSTTIERQGEYMSAATAVRVAPVLQLVPTQPKEVAP
jgi:hypothetical protein